MSISEITDLTLLLLHFVCWISLISLLPYPRIRMFSVGLIVVGIKGVNLLLLVGSVTRPILTVLRVDFQSTTLSVLVAVSHLSSRIGGYVIANVDRDDFRYSFDERVGDHMVEFRRTLKRIFVDEIEQNEEISKPELRVQIRDLRSQISRKHTIGELIVGVGGGLIAILFSRINIVAGVVLLLSIYLAILPISMALRSMIVGKLSYDVERVTKDGQPAARQSPRGLIFQKQWNQMLLNNETLIHKMIFMSFVRDDFLPGYERGEELIRDVLQTDTTVEEALDELVHSELGEDTTSGKSVRAALKWVFGE